MFEALVVGLLVGIWAWCREQDGEREKRKQAEDRAFEAKVKAGGAWWS